MNLPERFPPDDPREWMNRARSDLTQAKNQVPGVYFENLCFNAQQATEKAIKAVMIARDIEFPYVHDLARLLSLLIEVGESIPAAISRASGIDQICHHYALSRRSQTRFRSRVSRSDSHRRSRRPMG